MTETWLLPMLALAVLLLPMLLAWLALVWSHRHTRRHAKAPLRAHCDHGQPH